MVNGFGILDFDNQILENISSDKCIYDYNAFILKVINKDAFIKKKN